MNDQPVPDGVGGGTGAPQAGSKRHVGRASRGPEVDTVEGMASADGGLHPIQEAFAREYGLQCGFCTPGFLMAVAESLREEPEPTEEEIRKRLSGNLCRCTGYQNIINAVARAAELMKGGTWVAPA